MGVRFYDKENMSNGDDYSSSTNTTTTTTRRTCNCNTCNSHQQQQQTATSSTTTATTQTSSNNLNFQKSGILKEIIGNCKEMRIEENIHNLRIVGNNNRIRITFNVGDITIIGNNTRLKIKTNHGLLKYTGNDGRICLGQNSTEQFVDYSGCNGVLKVQNSKKQNKHDNNNSDEFKNKSPMGNTYLNGNSNKKSNIKSASYSGSPSESEMPKCHMDYNNIFNRKISMPNIKLENRNQQKQKPSQQHQQPKSIVHNFGNIVIANSSNVCITPYTYTY